MSAIARSLAGVLLLSAATLAQERPPASGEPRPFSLPEVKRYALPNDMDVRLVQYGDVPKTTIRLVIQTGNVDEKPNEVWLADLTGDLMEQGTSTKTAQEVAVAAARMGGSVEVTVGANQFTVGSDVLSEFAHDAIALIGDVALRPAFPDSDLPRLKKDMLRRLSIARSQPQQLALEAFRKVMYPEQPYGRIFPTETMVEAYTIGQVKAFYDRSLGAARASIYVVGRFDEAAVRKAIGDVFTKWTRGSPGTDPPVRPYTKRAIHIVDRPGAVQSTIYMGNPVVTPKDQEYLPLLVTNTLLGGYFSSRITSNIREDKGYTYSPASAISSRLGSAYFVQIADVTTAVTGASLKEIFYEIDRLQETPPSEEELRAVKSYMSGTFVLQNSSRPGIAGQLTFLDLYGLGEDYLRTYVQRVNALTPRDIHQMAQKYLRDEEMTIVVVGDRKAILDQVKPFGPISN
jgi:predicted Zn-dependent peptidase